MAMPIDGGSDGLESGNFIRLWRLPTDPKPSYTANVFALCLRRLSSGRGLGGDQGQ